MTKPRWTRRKDARPREILEAALDVFAERGFAAARLDEVATRAGVSKGTLYLYFPSKEDLFRSVVRELLLPNIAAAEQRLAQHRGSAADLLRTLVMSLGRAIAETRLGAIPKLIIAESVNFPDLAAFYHDEVIRRGAGIVAGIVRRGIAAGEFRPVQPEQVFPEIVGPLLVLAVWKHGFERAGVAPLPAEAMLASHVDFVLRGLAADRPHDRAADRAPDRAGDRAPDGAIVKEAAHGPQR